MNLIIIKQDIKKIRNKKIIKNRDNNKQDANKK